jgi:hypothetical protein
MREVVVSHKSSDQDFYPATKQKTLEDKQGQDTDTHLTVQ